MPDSIAGELNLKSLREQVYDYLREALRHGRLAPGSPIRLGSLSEQLGVSRTPLRDALHQLAWEGFVTIHPRRGIIVSRLTLASIRHLYQIIGALESQAILDAAPRLGAGERREMNRLLDGMDRALDDDDFRRYYQHNLAFHEVPLALSDNSELLRLIRTHRQRLYDFPRKPGFVKDWELASNHEHRTYLEHLAAGDGRAAAEFMRDVHWAFAVQEEFVRRYYAEEIDDDAS